MSLLGFAVVSAGLIGLWRVFHRERDQARQALEQQRQTLEHYARQALEQRLGGALRAAGAEAESALRDPLLPAGHLLWVEAGRQLLPRVVAPVPGASTPGEELYLRLLAADLAATETDTPWSRQQELHRRFQGALARGREAEIEASFRALLRHRARYRTAPERDLPAMLALLHAFSRDSSPAPELFRALLHDGLDAGRGGRLESLSRLLLEHRNRFTAADFAFLGGRVVELATAAEVPYQAFLDRSRERPETITIPAEIAPGQIELLAARGESQPHARARDFSSDQGAEPQSYWSISRILQRRAGGKDPLAARPDYRHGLLDAGRWLVRQEPGGELVGVRIELGDLLREVSGEMRSRGLLITGDVVRPAEATLASRLPLELLDLDVDSGRWPRQAADIEARYRLKAGLLLLSAVLAASMATLAAALRARRFRLVELKSEFVAAVSHELRTPLASVRLMAETVARRAGRPDLEASDLKDYPERIVREIDGLSFLVENILSFNRLERRRVEPRLTDVPLAELVDQVREEIAVQVDRPVVIEGAEDLAEVTLTVDRELFKLLLLNLARNAALYNDRDPVVLAIEHRVLESEPQARAPVAEIVVRDNGRGIPEDERGRVFEEFYRPRESSRRSRGTGLGLAICRRIAELHRGTIDIVASSPAGTSFRLQLPATRGARIPEDAA